MDKCQYFSTLYLSNEFHIHILFVHPCRLDCWNIKNITLYINNFLIMYIYLHYAENVVVFFTIFRLYDSFPEVGN